MNQLIIRDLGKDCNYIAVCQQAIDFINKREITANDELWLFECQPAFTRGANYSGVNFVGGTIISGDDSIISPGSIPIITTDRVGGNAYHGPGQLICVVLADLKRKNLNYKKLLSILYSTLLQLLASYGIDAKLRDGKHRLGPFVDGNKKIGFVDTGVCADFVYYGLSLNVDMDLSPFEKINHCGIVGYEITHLKNYLNTIDLAEIKQRIVNFFSKKMKYSQLVWKSN